MAREVRICEVCGMENRHDNMECARCNEDLACTPITWVEDKVVKREPSKSEPSQNGGYIPPVTNIKRTAVLSYNRVIKNRIDGKSIEIPLEGCMIGRSGNIEPNYFDQFPFISNYHATLRYENFVLIVKDNNSTNGTKVNGVRLNSNEERTLNVGDKLTFANIEFVIE